MTFVRFETYLGDTIAIFQDDGEQEETRMCQSSLETRLKNLANDCPDIDTTSEMAVLVEMRQRNEGGKWDDKGGCDNSKNCEEKAKLADEQDSQYRHAQKYWGTNRT